MQRHIMIDILPLLQPAGIIFGLIGLYLSLAHGLDIFQALFRAVLIYAGFVLLGLIFQFIFILMVKKVRIREAQRLIEEQIRFEEEARLEAEENNQNTENQ
ncbi:MAG: hypothetical protein H8E46_12910 [FCB group bacterium]|nr:hypothetical protein [FCB group bacterium]